MAAVTRWVEYSVSASPYPSASSPGTYNVGERAYKEATLSVGDTFTINSSNNKLYVNIDGAGAQTITLASGTGLDPRFVAKDIAEKIHALDSNDRYQFAQCEWRLNKFWLYSGTAGSSSSFTVSSGVNTAHLTLGFTEGAGTGGTDTASHGTAYGFTGTLVTSGTWYGFWDEVYHVMIGGGNSNYEAGINFTPTQGGGNTYAGTMTVGGVFPYSDSTARTYQIDVDVTNGTTVGAGTGNVPRYKVQSTGNFDDYPATYQDMLYPNYWYPVGTAGVRVKWTDAVFNTASPAWTITIDSPEYAAASAGTAPIGTAEYVWGSNRGDDSTNTSITTVSGGYTRLGTRGLYLNFNGTGSAKARSDFWVMCRAPQPSSYGISQLNYGNVTVSTESPVKTVAFEIMSGAYEMSAVKFGLQSHGTFSHHNENDSDTYFRFGTVGPSANAGSNPTDGQEWWVDVAAADIDNDTPPAYLYATEDNLSVVASADASEDIGNLQLYLQADPIWVNIRLGANETGANSTINYRLYFDYS
jgi:hypothetical protein